MKIAFVSMPGDIVVPPYLSSQGLCTYELARRLVRHSDVIVYAVDHPLNKKTEIGEGVRYRCIKAYPDVLLRKLIYPFSRFRLIKQPFFTSRLCFFMYAMQVAKDLRSERCDVAHIHNFPQFIPVIKAFNPKIKIVLHNHNEMLVQLDKETTKKLLRNADLIVSCSEHVSGKIRGAFPEFAERCHTIYNGVDIDHFSPSKSGNNEKCNVKRLLFVGRVSPEKGLHVLVDAFKKVVEQYPEVELKIVGPKEPIAIHALRFLVNDQRIFRLLASFYDSNSHCSYVSYLQNRLSELDLSDKVIFTGFIPHLQTVNYYRDAYVYVHASFNEAFGIPVIEAMSTEVPVIVTNVGGLKEIVKDGETGILVKPGDAEQMAEAIIRLLLNKNLRERMGKAARKRAAEVFSWDKIAENLLRLYINVLLR